MIKSLCSPPFSNTTAEVKGVFFFVSSPPPHPHPYPPLTHTHPHRSPPPPLHQSASVQPKHPASELPSLNGGGASGWRDGGMEERLKQSSCDVAMMFCGAQREPLAGPTPSRLAAAHPDSSRREIAAGNCCCCNVVRHGVRLAHYPPQDPDTLPPTSPPLARRSNPPQPADAIDATVAISQWECPLNGNCFPLLPCQLLL